MKFESPYMLYSGKYKWYIIPYCEFLDVLPEPNRYLSFWFKYNADMVLAAMNAAWRDGNRMKK